LNAGKNVTASPQTPGEILSTRPDESSEHTFPKLFRLPRNPSKTKPRHIGEQCFHCGLRQLMISSDQEPPLLHIGDCLIRGPAMVGQVGHVTPLRDSQEQLIQILGRSPPRFVCE
jgi:hypothetical protein